MAGFEFTRAADAAAVRRHVDVVAAAFAWDFEALPADPVADYLPALAGPVSGLDVEFWIGTADGIDVSAAVMRCPIHDNLDMVASEVFVHPEHRRRGHGRALVDRVIQRTRGLGRTRLIGE